MTRDKLKMMKSGEVLEVIGDFPQAKDNIRRFVEKDGYQLLSIVDGNGCYKILISVK